MEEEPLRCSPFLSWLLEHSDASSLLPVLLEVTIGPDISFVGNSKVDFPLLTCVVFFLRKRDISKIVRLTGRDHPFTVFVERISLCLDLV